MEKYGQYGVQCVFTQQQTEKRQSNYQETGQEPRENHQGYEGCLSRDTIDFEARRGCRRLHRAVGQAKKIHIPEQKQLWTGQEA